MTGNRIITFLREVREELKKVSWPSRRETVRLTVVVIAVSAVVGLYLSGIDFLLSKLLGLLVAR